MPQFAVAALPATISVPAVILGSGGSRMDAEQQIARTIFEKYHYWELRTSTREGCLMWKAAKCLTGAEKVLGANQSCF
jgi:hypothetical protein